jgi:hypothetical protein
MVVLVIMLLTIAVVICGTGLLLSLRPLLSRRSPAPPKQRRDRGRMAPRAVARAVAPVAPGEPVALRLRTRARQQPLPSQLRRRAAVSLSVSVAPERIYGAAFPGRAIPWKALLIGLISLVILLLYGAQLFLPHTGFLLLNPWETTAPTATSQAPHYNATASLVRISQLDPAQYDSPQQYQTWAYSACSAAAMTVVINAYGHHYRIADILKVEAAIGEITPAQGLLEEVGIARTATRFGFDTVWGHNLSLDQVIAIANGGRPVIVSFPPDRFPGGHLLVVRGGNADTVYLIDSSRLDYTAMTRSRFLSLWGGFYAVLTPHRS